MIKKQKYVPIYVATGVLVLMVMALAVLLLMGNKTKKYIPNKPKDFNTSIGITSNNFDSLRNLDNKNLSSKHYLIKYDKKGVNLSTPSVTLVNDKILVNNSLEEENPYLSVINLDGKEEFTTKIPLDKYESFDIKKAGECNGNYCVVSIGNKGDTKSLLISYIDKKGKFISTKKVNVLNPDSVIDVHIKNNEIVVVSQNDDLVVELIKDDKIVSTYNLDDDDNDKFITDNPILMASYYDSKNAYLICNGNKTYLYKIDLSTKKSIVKELTNANNVENFEFKDNGLYGISEKVLYNYSLEGNYLSKIDYSTIELENKEEYISYIIEEDKEKSNFISIEGMNKNNDNTLEVNTFYSTIFDEIDNGKIIKRYLINRVKKQYYGILLSSFIKDGKIYDIYSYGYDEPMLLINIMK